MNPQTLFEVRKAGVYFPYRMFCVGMIQDHLPVQRVCRTSALDNQSVRLNRGKEYPVRTAWGAGGFKSLAGNGGEETKFFSTLVRNRTGPPTAVTSHCSSLCAIFAVNRLVYCFALHSINACLFPVLLVAENYKNVLMNFAVSVCLSIFPQVAT